MARNSEFFLGDNFIDVIKLGDDDIKIYLQDTLIYQPRISISTATVTCNVATYNGNPQSAATIQVTVGGNQLTLNEDFIVTSNTGGTNVGSYNVTVQGIGLYKGNASGTFTINKVTPTVVAPVPNVLTYNGTAQKLVTPGSTNFGTLKYKVGSSGSYSTNIPTRTRGGAYTVYYKVDGDSNINGVPENSVACSINEKPVTAVVAVSPSSYTYSGSYCEPTVTVKDGETVIDPSEYTVTYSNNLNAGTATVTIYDVVGGNYYVTGSTTFKIAKQTPVLATSPTSTSPTYNGSVQNLLTGGSMKHSSSVSTAVPGSFTYDQGTNAGSYSNPKWYFTPTDTTNYNSTNGTVKTTTTISCSSNYTITAPTAKSGLVYNGSSQTLYNAGSSATVSGSFGYTGGTMTNAGSQTVSWVFTPSSANYCSKNGSFTGSIAQKAISIPTPTGVSRAYNGNAATATFGSATGASITKYRYSTNGSSWTESTTNPSQINAGTLYTQAYYKANNANYSGEGWSNSATITISKANQSAPTASGATTTYNTTATATASGGGSQGYIEWSNGNTQTSVGSKATKARWSGNGNYNASPWSNSVTLTMNKAAGSVTTAPVNNNYTYNGTARAVATAGSGTGTMYYRLGSSGSFSTTMPTMTDAGSSTLYYYAAASTNYEKSATGTTTESEQNASHGAPTAYGATTTYNTTATATASGGGKQGSLEWESAQSQTSVGSHSTRARWSGNDNYNASPWSNSVTLTMNKAAGSVTTAPVNNNYTYNGTARAVASAGSGTGTMYYRLGSSGSFSTTMPTMTDAGSSTLYYYAAASTNYEQSATGSITVSVQKASQSAPTATGATTTYNTTATAKASGGGGQGSIVWSNGNTQTSVGSKTTMARWGGNSNYNASPWSNSVTVTMNKVTPTVTAPTLKTGLVYNGTAQELVTPGSTNYGTLMYRDTEIAPESDWDAFDWITTVPTATNSNSELPHQIQYKVVGNSNVNDVAMVKLGSTSIARANSTISATIPPTITVGSTASITNVSSTGDGGITYSSNDTSKATVSSSGVITGKEAGTVTITVTMGPGINYNPSSTSKTVTINAGTTTVTAVFMGPPFNSIGGTIDLKNFAFYGVSDNNAYVPLLITSNNQDVTSSFKNKNGGKPLRDLKNYCVLNSISNKPTLITNMFANVPTYSGSYSITISRNGQIRYDKNSDTITIYFVTG